MNSMAATYKQYKQITPTLYVLVTAEEINVINQHPWQVLWCVSLADWRQHRV